MFLSQDGEHMRSAKVISHSKDDMGNKIGVRDTNPILDNHVYHVMYPDVSLKQYAENIISENT